MMSIKDPTRMTISEAARYVRRAVRTLQRWDREGTLTPEGRTPTNRRFYTKRQLDAFLGIQNSPPAEERKTFAYCRVSSHAQKQDLADQKKLLETFCAARGLADVEWIEEVGGGLNFKRPKFTAMMEAVERGEAKAVVVAHRDRLARFGFDWFEGLCKRKNCQLLVLNAESTSPETELVEDLMAAVDSFADRLPAAKKCRKALKEDTDKAVS